MAVVNRISEQEYLDLAFNEPDRFWELWDGVPVEKPLMSMRHNSIAFYLGYLLQFQLDRGVFRINVNGDRTRFSSRSYFIPDIIVIPATYQAEIGDGGNALGIYPKPLPLVVEVWSPSTGHYDIAVKLQAYKERGDQEIWYIHPKDRTLTAWRLQPDGSYSESLHRGEIVPVTSLPGVTIDLDALLDG